MSDIHPLAHRILAEMKADRDEGFNEFKAATFRGELLEGSVEDTMRLCYQVGYIDAINKLLDRELIDVRRRLL